MNAKPAVPVKPVAPANPVKPRPVKLPKTGGAGAGAGANGTPNGVMPVTGSAVAAYLRREDDDEDDAEGAVL